MATAVKRLQNYVKDAYAEIQKVTWPTQQQTINYTVLVVIMTLFVAVFFSLLDYIFSTLLTFLV